MRKARHTVFFIQLSISIINYSVDHDQLSKFFAGELTPQEKELLLSSLLADEKQLEEAAKLKNSWAAAQLTGIPADSATARQGWKAFRVAVVKQSNNRSWWRIAVAALFAGVILSAAFFAGYLVNKKEPVPVAYHTLSVPAGQYAQLTLSDGSEIWLNSRSKLIYPDRFESDIREVQFEGEGFFKVTSDKNHPFIVKTEAMDVIATGTKFNISAYEDDAWISTTLIEGVVKLSSSKYGIDYSLTESNMAVYDKLKNTLVVNPTDTDMQISWIKGEFRFKEMDFDDIAKRLERNFNVKFVFKDNSLKQKIFTGTFYNHQSIESILRVMKTSTLKMNYTLKNDTIYIK